MDEIRVRLRWFAGFAASCAWIPLLALGDATLLVDVMPLSAKANRLLTFVACAAVLALALAWRSRGVLVLTSRRATLVGVLCLSLGAAFGSLPGIADSASTALRAASTLKGAGAGVLIASWPLQISGIDRRLVAAGLTGAVGCAFAMALVLLVAARVAPQLMPVIAALVPLPALAAPRRAFIGSEVRGPSARRFFRAPAISLASAIALGAMFGFALNVPFRTDSPVPLPEMLSLVALAASMVVCASAAAASRADMKVDPRFFLLVPPLALALPLVTRVSDYYVVPAVICAGWTAMLLMATMICEYLAERSHSSRVVLSWNILFGNIVAAAIIFGIQPSASPHVSLGTGWLVVIGLAVISPLLLAAPFLPNRHGQLLWGYGDHDAGRNASVEDKCAIARDRYHLTPREVEVLIMLSRGRNAEHIERALVLSRFTVKTHMRHIYAKLGVHTHQDLIDLVDSLSRE